MAKAVVYIEYTAKVKSNEVVDLIYIIIATCLLNK